MSWAATFTSHYWVLSSDMNLSLPCFFASSSKQTPSRMHGQDGWRHKHDADIRTASVGLSRLLARPLKTDDKVQRRSTKLSIFRALQLCRRRAQDTWTNGGGCLAPGVRDLRRVSRQSLQGQRLRKSCGIEHHSQV